MGLGSNVTGFGPFKKSISMYLDYPENYYSDTKEGALIMTELLHVRTSGSSRELATLLGVDVWDFNTHKIDPSKVNWDGLKELFSPDGVVGDSEEQVDELKELLEAGFTFIFQPNG